MESVLNLPPGDTISKVIFRLVKCKPPSHYDEFLVNIIIHCL